MSKAEIKKINDQMKNVEDFGAIRTMLEIIGKMDSKVYGIINHRVVFLREDHGQIEYHDAYAWAD